MVSPPRPTTAAVPEMEMPEPEPTVLVATEPNLAGVPLVVVQYESWPMTSPDEVETFPEPPPPVAENVPTSE